MRNIDIKKPNIDSRYFLKCSYRELINRSLTKKIYSIIKEEGECTTKKILSELKRMGINKHRYTILSYLNTMTYYGLLKKKIKGANTAYWSLTEKSISNEELLKERDIDGIKETHSDLLFFPNNRIHLYGISQELYENYKNEINKSLSILERELENLLRFRIKSIFKIIKKYFEESIKDAGEWEKIAKLIFIFDIFEHIFPENMRWCKEENGKIIIKCDIELARLIRKHFIPYKEINEIIEKLDGFSFALTKELSEIIRIHSISFIPLIVVLFEDIGNLFTFNNLINVMGEKELEELGIKLSANLFESEISIEKDITTFKKIFE